MNKLFKRVSVGLMVMALACITVITSFAAPGDPSAGTMADATDGAKTMLSAMTESINIANISIIIASGLGIAAILFLFWWGSRKLVRMVKNAFSKGKLSL